jgi:hypothetical protein
MYLYSSIPCTINSFPGFHNPHLAFAVYGCHASCRSAIYYATSDWLTLIRTGRSLLFVRKRSFHGLNLNIPRSCYNAAPNPYRSIGSSLWVCRGFVAFWKMGWKEFGGRFYLGIRTLKYGLIDVSNLWGKNYGNEAYCIAL